ncbi:hypothetical protein K8I61_09510 [bacterium]|nr:hypothetical protein [bacterium]
MLRSTARKALPILLLLALFAMGCASKAASGPEESNFAQDELMRQPLKDPPSYGLFHDSMEFYEQKLGIKFYKNDKGRYLPYSTSTWKSFSIADQYNSCLYDFSMKGLIGYRSLEGRFRYVIEMDFAEGPCGVQYPNVDVTAMDKVTLMEGSVITPALKDQLGRGLNFCSAEKFLQQVLQVPWKIRVRGEGLEQAIARYAEEIKNPMDITYGDIVFFTRYYGERNVAIYVDYGVIVYNSCFKAKARRMTPDINYRVYRLYTGFSLAEYKVHQDVFMQDIVGRPEY